jgi:hypothetical protein
VVRRQLVPAAGRDDDRVSRSYLAGLPGDLEEAAPLDDEVDLLAPRVVMATQRSRACDYAVGAARRGIATTKRPQGIPEIPAVSVPRKPSREVDAIVPIRRECAKGAAAGTSRPARARDQAPAISATSCAASVGVVPTRTPRASSAAFLACAVPADPEMIAPACPIVLPGGAVNPAM